MESTLKVILYLIALVAVITATNVLIGGAAAIPGAAGGVDATVDNELRFFSIFWLAYGGFCFWIARNIRHQYFFIPYVAAVFFLGGVARLISTLSIGLPSTIFVPAMMLELLIPIVIYPIYRSWMAKNLSTSAE